MSDGEGRVYMQRTSRDPHELRLSLQKWLSTKVGVDADVSELSSTDANGMSSDTVLFTASWTVDGEAHNEDLVARIAPDTHDVPVFPSYDLQTQFDVISLVQAETGVPVPKPWWCENDLSVIGAPFFLMSQVKGAVPPDNLPYSFGNNWLFDATPEQQRELQDSTVDAIAALHAIPDVATRVPSLVRSESGDTRLRQHVAHSRYWYDVIAADGMVSPLVERGFAWLEEHWPAVESEPVLSWGDSRIGNVIYDGFRPAALLDWEMAGIGPAELDIAWLICGHIVFQDLANGLGLPGMPDFMQTSEVVDRYRTQRGVELRDLDFYLTYAVVQWAIVFLRTGQRNAHFQGQPLPDDLESFIYCRNAMENMLSK